MSKAILILDPDRRPEQLTWLQEQVPNLHGLGDAFWASLTPAQADRIAQRGILVQLYEGADLVELPAIVFDPDAGEPNPPALFTAATPTGDRTAYYLVQFFAPVESEWITEIEQLGGLYIQNLPTHTVVFRLTASQVTVVQQLEPVTWVGLYHPAYAISYLLTIQAEAFQVNTLQTLQLDPAAIEIQDTGSIELLFFDDIDLANVRSLITNTGATITTETGYSLILNATMAQLPALILIPGVRVVEPYFSATVDNQKAGIIIAANQVRDLSSPTNFFINLNGSGEIVSILDSGLDTGNLATLHPDLQGRVLQLNNLNGAALPTGDIAPHGTHVAGSIAGDGTQSGGQIRGVAPASQIIFHALRPTAGNGILANQFLTGFLASHQLGARVHSNSWGQTAAASQYSNAISGIIDQFVCFNPDSLVLFAAGNNERDANNDGILDMRRLSTQTVAKNILSIGASENVTNTDGDNRTFRQRRPTFYNAVTFDTLAGATAIAGNFPISDNADHVALFSDRGRVADPGIPVARRRIKPDLVAPGTNIISTRPRTFPAFSPGDFKIPNTISAADYYLSNGTSMATPIAAGSALLVRQYYRTRHGQSRRPLLLELSDQYRDRTAMASHSDGTVIAWIRRDTGTNQNHIVAARYQDTQQNLGDAPLMRLGDIVQLQANVGNHPVPVVAQSRDRTLLLHQASDNSLRLRSYNRDLTPTLTFGTQGIVTLTPAARIDVTRPPTMLVHGDEVAMVWHQTGTDNLLFQRYRSDTGAAIGSSLTLGTATSTSPHPYLTWTGDRYAIAWVYQDGATYKLQLRMVNETGTLVGTQPTTLQSQPQEIRDPHLIADIVSVNLIVVWVSAMGGTTGDELKSAILTIPNTGEPAIVGTVNTITPTPDTITGAPLPLPVKGIRRPRIAIHPQIFTGYVLTWEDDTHLVKEAGVWQSRYDVYLTFLNLAGQLDGRIVGNRLRISDTPKNTNGFTSLATTRGIVITWGSNDELNARDSFGTYALKLTSRGALQSQIDSNVPMIDSGRYVRHTFYDEHQPIPSKAIASLVWSGGDYFILRSQPDNPGSRLLLTHTNSDGRLEEGGDRQLGTDLTYENLHLHWANTRLIALWTSLVLTKVALLDGTGNLIQGFGTHGIHTLELTTPAVFPQVAHRGSGNQFRVLIAYGSALPNVNLRYILLNAQGQTVGIHTLAPATGTAERGWFHNVESETPDRIIAAWHHQVAGNLQVLINRFHPTTATAQHSPAIRLTTLPGDSQNAVIAPRPVLFGLDIPTQSNASVRRRQREYGITWEYHPPANAPTELRFSRLNRNGTVSVTKDIRVINSATHHATAPQLIWHSDGYGLAWLSQPIAGGEHTLCFTLLDPNGARSPLSTGGTAPIYTISGAGRDVSQFHLVWNGRTCRMVWTEREGDQLKQVQATIAVPRQTNSYDQPYEQPSAALIRATLINGATNLNQTALPNLSSDPNHGYGWGRINIRQSIAPLPPVTFQVRDDNAIATGSTVQYSFYLPPNTKLLRITLAWTDPPGNRLVNNLNLQVTAPPIAPNPSHVYVGNRWQSAPNAQLSDPLPNPAPPNPFESIHNTEQVVITNPPTGIYQVNVMGGAFAINQFQQFAGQPYAIVFMGSGDEVRFSGALGGALPFY